MPVRLWAREYQSPPSNRAAPLAGIGPAATALSPANAPVHSPARASANRRAANALKAPQFAKDTDGGSFRPHRVNPKTGIYRGRQVLNVEV